VADKYEPSIIERKWQQYWEEHKLFESRRRADRPKFYLLDMFPYPSGDLHMGHVRAYVIGDVVARYYAMRGYNLMHPMGWDAFGLPAENAAIQRQIHPAEWTARCIENMKAQFKRLGISYDWNREINASSPDYYKWTQWLFLQLYHAGLAYRGETTVNWCPSCQTVLANEELEGGTCERCHTPVIRKRAGGQWFFAITKYADRLLDDLRLLNNWPERVRVMQENWIGRSEGVRFSLQVDGRPDKQIEVFTTRIDTIYGITYVVLAPEHPLVEELIQGTDHEARVREFVAEALKLSEMERTAEDTEKRGVFTGAYAIHPLTGEKVPIWVGNYVLMEYGTGAIMAVPAHDQRDFEFARKYDLPIKVVIQPSGQALDPATMTEAYVEAGYQVHSAEFDGMYSEDAKAAIADKLEQLKVGQRDVGYKLRDWLLSRQRYWGAPIPIIYCDKCGTVPVPEEDLPVLLPETAEFKPTGESPLAANEEFVNTTCPRCGGPARRETDTMTTFVCSSWYYLRYASPDADDVPFRREDVDYWLPVDKYVGGVEHAVRHLLYARFITKVLYDLGYIGFQEPFTELFTQGMIYKDGRKMSKRGNAVTPEEIEEKYGADTGRVYILFMGPPELDAEWNDQGVEGAYRFLCRVWRLVAENTDKFIPHWSKVLDGRLDERQRAIRRKTHQTILNVTEDIQTLHLNTSVSELMELTNVLLPFAESLEPADELSCAVFSEAVQMLLLLLSPLAPHIADELWERIGMPPSIYQQSWPEADPALAAEEEVTIVVQVNGKVRGKLQVPAGTDMERVQDLALELEAVKRQIAGKDIKRIIPVPGKLINIVAK